MQDKVLMEQPALKLIDFVKSEQKLLTDLPFLI